MKVFVADIARCNGCHNCQIACKDEHCDNEWMPYTRQQPEIGQFWFKLDEKVRGQVPAVKISYYPRIGGQIEALREYAPEVLMDRDDGILVIDPEKAEGRKDIADKFEGIYWNEELKIPQTCTGCAHLMDDGWTEPRCVDSCPTEALKYVELEEALAMGAERLPEGEELGSHFYYLNYPKRFAAGCVVDRTINEVLIGATVTLKDAEGNVVSTQTTDEFGDYRFDQIEPACYNVLIEADGYQAVELKADVTEIDIFLGDQFMVKA